MDDGRGNSNNNNKDAQSRTMTSAERSAKSRAKQMTANPNKVRANECLRQRKSRAKKKQSSPALLALIEKHGDYLGVMSGATTSHQLVTRTVLALESSSSSSVESGEIVESSSTSSTTHKERGDDTQEEATSLDTNNTKDGDDDHDHDTDRKVAAAAAEEPTLVDEGVVDALDDNASTVKEAIHWLAPNFKLEHCNMEADEVRVELSDLQSRCDSQQREITSLRHEKDRQDAYIADQDAYIAELQRHLHSSNHNSNNKRRRGGNDYGGGGRDAKRRYDGCGHGYNGH